ncbi:bifunctional non-homologous end joining protein LigD [Crossiella equi]|uniref:Bifunctional non-homologous end joining protein LigD n=1 Tax=Crossiella equi TaxID=130796 RepID=A0ABS5A4Y7_9PSEU|nr:non-homologous end-joining DNA ligase [Crossiella equi]MBP2471644.1 bifunctional non-homologous end joining protein LigD [Crossiella equi]
MRTESVVVDERRLRLSNLDKVLYPLAGTTKAEVIDYYARVSRVILPHLAHRPVTLRRFPDGSGTAGFFEKDVSRHAPDWVRTVEVATPGSGKDRDSAHFAVIEDEATLLWAANLAALELHVPQWTVGPRGGIRDPDLLVFDLDPGAPADLVHCCRVAEHLRTVLTEDGLTAYPKTSGGKGLQLYVPVRVSAPERTSAYAKSVAERLARQLPNLVLAHQSRADRKGRVLIDWSQNNPAKTTVAVYSLRAQPKPTVSTPVTWSEVEDCTKAGQLRFGPAEVLERVEEDGDLWRKLLARHGERALPR